MTDGRINRKRASAEAIRSARQARGWSMDWCAEKVGTSRQQWIRWEQGLHLPGEKFAPRLVSLLGLDPSLFDDDEDGEASPSIRVQDLFDALMRVVERELAAA